MKFSRIPAIATVCFALSFAFAQTRKTGAKDLPLAAFKLKSVKITGTTRYKPEDVIGAAGLQIGQPVHDADLKNVVRLLGESGAFTAVSYTSQFDPEGTKVDLQLRDAERFFPARFDNVVWFSDRELREKLHAAVPLFDGQLPFNGGLAGEVSEALQVLLIQKKVAGQVDYLRPSQENQVEAFVFSISGPNITIRNVELSGAGSTELPLLEAAAKRLQGTEYARPAIRALEDKAFLPIYRERGYLEASLGDPEPSVAENDAHDTLVDVTIPVTPGPQYKLASIEIAGYKAVPLDALHAAFLLHPGEIANLVELEKDLEAIRHLYGTHGYMGASVKAEASMEDHPAPRIVYKVSIVEGDVYKMGEVEIRGLDSRTTARLQNDWTLRAGETYDSSYVGRFVEQAYKEIGDWHVSVHESIDPHDKTVDVTVRFDPNS